MLWLGVPVGLGDRVKRRFQRKFSALGLPSSAEDALETSEDVIRKTLRTNRGNLSRFFTKPGRVHSFPFRGLGDGIDVRQITT